MRTIAVVLVLACVGCGDGTASVPTDECCHQSSKECEPFINKVGMVWTTRCTCLTCDMRKVVHTYRTDYSACENGVPCYGVRCGSEYKQIGDWNEMVEHEPCQ